MTLTLQTAGQRLVSAWLAKLLPELPFDVTRHTIPVVGLPEAFHGFRIVQISDLHIEHWNRPVVEAAIDVVNQQQADLVVSTGDVIAHGPRHLGDVTYLLAQMQARHGKLACLGNHDYDDGSGSEAVRQAMTKAGFEVLVNESTELTIDHQRLQLAGADDLILGRQCLGHTSRRLDRDRVSILLSHNPENFEAMSAFQPDLILSGHTHGGQIHLPLSWHAHLMGSPYIAGLYQRKRSQLYVNRGLGSAIWVKHIGDRMLTVPTPRFVVRPEISVFTLTCPDLS